LSPDHVRGPHWRALARKSRSPLSKGGQGGVYCGGVHGRTASREGGLSRSVIETRWYPLFFCHMDHPVADSPHHEFFDFGKAPSPDKDGIIFTFFGFFYDCVRRTPRASCDLLMNSGRVKKRRNRGGGAPAIQSKTAVLDDFESITEEISASILLFSCRHEASLNMIISSWRVWMSRYPRILSFSFITSSS